MKKEFVNIIKVYLITLLIIVIWFVSRTYYEDITLSQTFKQLIELLSYKSFLLLIHVLFLIVYCLFLTLRYFIRVYKSKGIKTMLKRLVIRLILPIFLIFYSIKIAVKSNTNDKYAYNWDYTFENKEGISNNFFKQDGKHRGMSVFGWESSNNKGINDLIKNNIEWVAVIPFFHQKDEQTNQISIPKEIGKWSRRDSTFINSIKNIHDKGIHVMLKPHLWVSSGWRSNIDLQTNEEWTSWFENYSKNILHYAQLASETNVALFCIGTELKTSIEEQPELWHELIQKIKLIYKGKLTYAANWDGEFNDVLFWNEMDYIGIQAYFPLTTNKSPNIQAINKGWNTHIKMLESLSKKHNKPILFTEIGYRSDATTTIKPWEWNSLTNIFFNNKSTKTQQLAFEAMFQKLWDKEWFSGTYIWQWDFRSSKERALNSMDFSPRFKPAENIIAKWYGKLILN